MKENYAGKKEQEKYGKKQIAKMGDKRKQKEKSGKGKIKGRKRN